MNFDFLIILISFFIGIFYEDYVYRDVKNCIRLEYLGKRKNFVVCGGKMFLDVVV